MIILICTYTYTCTHIYTYPHMYTYDCMFIRTHTHTHGHKHILTRTHAYTHTHTHTHTPIHSHTYTHMYMHVSKTLRSANMIQLSVPKRPKRTQSGSSGRSSHMSARDRQKVYSSQRENPHPLQRTSIIFIGCVSPLLCQHHQCSVLLILVPLLRNSERCLRRIGGRISNSEPRNNLFPTPVMKQQKP